TEIPCRHSPTSVAGALHTQSGGGSWSASVARFGRGCCGTGVVFIAVAFHYALTGSASQSPPVGRPVGAGRPLVPSYRSLDTAFSGPIPRVSPPRTRGRIRLRASTGGSRPASEAVPRRRRPVPR